MNKRRAMGQKVFQPPPPPVSSSLGDTGGDATPLHTPAPVGRRRRRRLAGRRRRPAAKPKSGWLAPSLPPPSLFPQSRENRPTVRCRPPAAEVRIRRLHCRIGASLGGIWPPSAVLAGAGPPLAAARPLAVRVPAVAVVLVPAVVVAAWRRCASAARWLLALWRRRRCGVPVPLVALARWTSSGVCSGRPPCLRRLLPVVPPPPPPARPRADRRLARAFLSAAPGGRGRAPLCYGGVVRASALERV